MSGMEKSDRRLRVGNRPSTVGRLPAQKRTLASIKLVGVTLKPWRVELKVMRLAELIADRHPDLRQTLFVEHQVFRDHLIEEEQVGRQRIDLIGSQSPLQPDWHAAI